MIQTINYRKKHKIQRFHSSIIIRFGGLGGMV